MLLGDEELKETNVSMNGKFGVPVDSCHLVASSSAHSISSGGPKSTERYQLQRGKLHTWCHVYSWAV